MAIIDFDDISTWENDLINFLGPLFSKHIPALQKHHEYVEDSLDTLLASTDRQKIIEATLDWISRNEIASYHGSRLTLDELNSVKRHGLLPLVAQARDERIRRALSAHPKWQSVSRSLPELIERGANGVHIGNRTNQVHLTLSRNALENGFNHYITHGSEFDQSIACQLLGQEGVDLLSLDGEPYIFAFAVPGQLAISAAHRYFSPEEMISRGSVPNIVNEFLKILSYRQFDPSYTPDRLKVHCGLVFKINVPTTWLISVIEVS